MARIIDLDKVKAGTTRSDGGTFTKDPVSIDPICLSGDTPDPGTDSWCFVDNVGTCGGNDGACLWDNVCDPEGPDGFCVIDNTCGS